MTATLLTLLLASFTLTGPSTQAETMTAPRDRALTFLNSWAPLSGTLEAADMKDAVEAFSRTFEIGTLEVPTEDSTIDAWTTRLTEGLGAEALNDPDVRAVVVEFLSRHLREFREAYEMAHEYHAHREKLVGYGRLEVPNNPSLADLAWPCGLVLSTLGATVGGGLATASMYGTPYGAVAGGVPIALVAGWRYAHHRTMPSQLERRARRAQPAFRTLLEAQKSFAAENAAQ